MLAVCTSLEQRLKSCEAVAGETPTGSNEALEFVQ